MHFIEILHTTEVTSLLYKCWKLQFRQNELSSSHSCFSCHPFPVLKISLKMWENCWSTNILLFSSLLPHWQELLIVSSSIFCSGEWRWCIHLLFVWCINMTWLWPRHVLDTCTQNWLCYSFFAHHGSYKILYLAYWKPLPSVVSSCNYTYPFCLEKHKLF